LGGTFSWVNRSRHCRRESARFLVQIDMVAEIWRM